VEKLSRAGGEMVLDFSAVGRIDPATARALEALADLAGQSSVRVVLRGVNIDIYKALKLLRLSPKLSFA
jgi:anti-anti-sigma regulatory factor